MRTLSQLRLSSLAVAAALCIILPGFTLAARTPGKIGVYCTLTTTEPLRKTMEDMKASGIAFILPYTKMTSGEVHWDSKVAPASLVTRPEFLGQVVEEAHRAGLQVYPVFCVATEGGETTPNAVLLKNPSWSVVVNGKRTGFIDPGNTAARKYEIDLMKEMINEYKIDGVSLDYMRGPNRIGYTDSAREEFLKRRGVDLAEVVKGTTGSLDTEGGKAGSTSASLTARNHPVWPEFREWRFQKTNEFMGELFAAVQQTSPGLPISSYCWGAHTYTGNFETGQDWKTWIAKGWLDWINPSGYRYTDDSFREAAVLNRQNVPKGFPYYITIGVSTSHGKLPDIAALRRQMEMSKQAGADGLVFFTWEALRRFLPQAADDIKKW